MHSASKFLILDDDVCFTQALAAIAHQEGYEVCVAHTLSEARALLSRGRMDLMLLDLELPDGSGMDLLDNLDLTQHGQVIIATGNPTIESATRAVAAPVAEYLIKPVSGERLQTLLRHALRRNSAVLSKAPVQDLAGRSPAIQQVTDMVLRVGPSDAAVMITGESGTGKELVARALHNASERRGPFVAINCGAVPAELLASQLFGHERGSFTGAHSRHIGVFEQAAHGTLFLDEITEMPLPLQVYLLRVLESGSITRVGGNETIDTPVRIVSATNRNPTMAVSAGMLREDLYYRLADISLVLPPLRERGDDILLLADLFVERLNTRYGRNKFISPKSFKSLLHHQWPGNVRELRSAVQRAYLLESGDALFVQPAAGAPSVLHETETSILFSIGTPLAEMERRMLIKTLAHYGNDKSATARALNVSVRTIHNQLGKLAGEEADATA